MNAEEILQTLMQADFRFEILIRSIVTALSEKKLSDGTPILTHEEVATVAEKIKNDFIEKSKSKIAKPDGLILPNG